MTAFDPLTDFVQLPPDSSGKKSAYVDLGNGLYVPGTVLSFADGTYYDRANAADGTAGDGVPAAGLMYRSTFDSHWHPIDEDWPLPVDVTGSVDVTQGTLPWVVSGVGGTLTVDDGGTTLSIDDGGGSITVDGTFWQATQPISAASLPLPTGAATSAKQDTLDTHLTDGSARIGGTVAVSGPLTDAQLRATPVPVSGSFTVDSEITTADFDTGAGTDTRAVIGLVLAESGGGLLVGSAHPLPVSGTFWQATQPVSVAAVVHVDDNGSTLSVDDGGGSLTVDGTVAATQSGGWTVTVQDGGNVISVDDAGGSLTVDGTVGVSGTVTADTELTTADLDTGAGTDTRAVVGLALAESGGALLVGSAHPMPVSGTFWQATQPVSGPLTDAQLRASAVPVSGTFWQATQPVSIAAAVAVTDNSGSLTIDSTQLPAALAANGGLKIEGVAGGVAVPVSGTFWQATQPVSIAAVVHVDDNAGSLTVDGTVGISGTVTVDSELTTADLDTGAGTDTRAVVGLVIAKSGGAANISNTDPLPVSDAGGSLTIDGTLTAITNVVHVDDNSGSLTVDSAQLPSALAANGGLKIEGVAGGVAVPVSGTFWQATQPVSIATAVPVTDNSGSLTVDNAGTFAVQADTELPSAAALGDNQANFTAPVVGSALLGWDSSSTSWYRIQNSRGQHGSSGLGSLAVVHMLWDGSFVLRQANASADGLSSSTVGIAASGLMGYNGTTWDRVRVANTGRLQVDVVTAPVTHVIADSGTISTITNVVHVDDNSGTLTVDAPTSAPLAVQGNVASGAADSGNPVKVGGVYRTTQPTLTDGQRGDSQLDTRGNLRVALMTLDGTTAASIGGGTQYAEDAALGSTPTGTLSMARRKDTLGTLTPVDDDAVSMRTNSRGALWVKHDGVVSVDDNAGSLTVDAPVGTPVFSRLSDGTNPLIGQKAMAASLPVVLASDQASIPVAATLSAETTKVIGTVNQGTSPWVVSGGTNVFHVDDNAGSVTVDAPVATPVFVRLSDGAAAITTLPVSVAAAAGSIAKAEDAAAVTGDVGVPPLLRRLDDPTAAAALTDTDGDYTAWTADSVGRARVTVVGESATASSQALSVAGAGSGANSTTNAVLNISKMGNVTVTVSGTWTVTAGAVPTLVFEGSDDSGTTWYPIWGSRADTGMAEQTVYAAAGMTRMWDFVAGGITHLRVRLSANNPASGSITVRITAGGMVYDPLPTVMQTRGRTPSFRAVYRLAAVNAIGSLTTGALTANTDKALASIHHANTATKLVRIRRVEVLLTNISAASTGIMFDLRRITTAPATGNPAITPVPNTRGDTSAEATCLALPGTAGTDEAAAQSLGSVELAAAAAVNYSDPTPLVLYDAQTDDPDMSTPIIRPYTLEGYQIWIRSVAAITIRCIPRITFTEE